MKTKGEQHEETSFCVYMTDSDMTELLQWAHAYEQQTVATCLDMLNKGFHIEVQKKQLQSMEGTRNKIISTLVDTTK